MLDKDLKELLEFKNNIFENSFDIHISESHFNHEEGTFKMKGTGKFLQVRWQQANSVRFGCSAST